MDPDSLPTVVNFTFPNPKCDLYIDRVVRCHTYDASTPGHICPYHFLIVRDGSQALKYEN